MSTRMHYQHADGRYSSLGYYDAVPEWGPEEGGEWVEGEPDGEQWQQVNLASQLSYFFAALPKEARGAFLPVLGGFKAALEMPQPDIEALQESAKALAIPPELESAKAALLEILQIQYEKAQ